MITFILLILFCSLFKLLYPNKSLTTTGILSLWENSLLSLLKSNKFDFLLYIRESFELSFVDLHEKL